MGGGGKLKKIGTHHSSDNNFTPLSYADNPSACWRQADFLDKRNKKSNEKHKTRLALANRGSTIGHEHGKYYYD